MGELHRSYVEHANVKKAFKLWGRYCFLMDSPHPLEAASSASPPTSELMAYYYSISHWPFAGGNQICQLLILLPYFSRSTGLMSCKSGLQMQEAGKLYFIIREGGLLKSKTHLTVSSMFYAALQAAIATGYKYQYVSFGPVLSGVCWVGVREAAVGLPASLVLRQTWNIILTGVSCQVWFLQDPSPGRSPGSILSRCSNGLSWFLVV